MSKSTLTLSFLLVSILLITSSCENSFKSGMIVQEINQGWEFSKEGDDSWLPASVPGCVHTDLLENGKIEDPFYRLNEHDLQWIDKENWVYQTTFHVESSLLLKTNMELFFPGLDTYADVWLNDTLVLSADNMFREWSIDCKNILQKGENKLKIIFHSPIKKGLEKYDALPYQIPVSDNDLAKIGKVEGDKQVSIFTRKAGYHFGWDWGPRLVTSGIWKPVFLRAWNAGRIKNIQIVQKELGEDNAMMEAMVEVEVDELSNADLVILVDGEEAARRTVDASNITHLVHLSFNIQDPQLWWPNGMGEQALYDVRVELRSGGTVIHKKGDRIGLRSIEVVREADQDGTSFYFEVNGRPIFMKGANYIPNDPFLTRVSDEKYQHVVQSAVDANMNMLRVWGGGIYEKDIFYDLCDEKGILVWQDFMFACAMFPGDTAFLENVKMEAVDNVRRLRNHPSIAVWCGNNECLSAWLRWGWKERIEEEQGQDVADIIWKGYEDLYHKLLPEVILNEDPAREFWSSSSSAEMGVPDNLTSGDLHYWGVWWGQEPFESFRENTGRFMSEYGFQSFPEMQTINKYATEEDWDIYSEVMKSHQRSSIGNKTIENYMNRDYRKPKDFPSFIYVGQVLQGEGIGRAIEIHRSSMPYCMGSLYWQINDCWPVASWSGMDYYGNWKAQHYRVKEAFENVILVPDIAGKSTLISSVSDLAESFNAILECSVMNLNGEVLWEHSGEVVVDGNTSKQVYTFNHEDIAGANNEKVLEVILKQDDEIVAENMLYYAAPKEIDYPEVDISTSITGAADGFEITLTSDKLAKSVYLQTEGVEGVFSNNYFDMIPGREYIITFKPASEVETLSLKVMSMVDAY